MTAIILIAAIAGLVWGTILAMRGSLVAGCVLYLVVTCCFGLYFFQFDVAGITLSLDRLLLVGLAAAFVVQWRMGTAEPKPWTRTDMLLGLLLGVLIVSTFTHDWHITDPHQVPIIQHLINGYLIPVAVYWIARQARLREGNVSLVLAALTAFGAYLAVTGMLESAKQWSLVFPHYIADPKIGLHFGRARGPMVHSVTYGLYLGTCLVAAWLWRERLSRPAQIIVLAVIPAILAAVYLTKTRTVWAGSASAMLVVMGLTLRGRMRVTVLGLMLAGGVVAVAAKSDAIMGVQREGTVEDTHRSNSMRAAFAYVSWQMFKERPIFGFGFGQFLTSKRPFLDDRSVDLQLQDIRDWVHHNTFLSLLTETGLVGLGLYLAVLTGWTRTAWRLARSQQAPVWARRHGVLTLGMLAVAVWQMLGHEITFTPMDHSLIFLIAGLAMGLAPLAETARSARPSALAAGMSLWDRRLPRPAGQ